MQIKITPFQETTTIFLELITRTQTESLCGKGTQLLVTSQKDELIDSLEQVGITIGPGLIIIPIVKLKQPVFLIGQGIAQFKGMRLNSPGIGKVTVASMQCCTLR